MANKQRGEFTLKAGSARYTLKLTTNAICEFEDFEGARARTFDEVMDGLKHGRLKDVRLFFWMALRAHHPDLATDDPTSLNAIGNLIDDAGGLAGVLKQIQAFIAINTEAVESVPKTKKTEGAADPLDAQVGTGPGSMPMRLRSA